MLRFAVQAIIGFYLIVPPGANMEESSLVLSVIYKHKTSQRFAIYLSCGT